MARVGARAKDPRAAILYKCEELIKLMNVHLNHFPKHQAISHKKAIEEYLATELHLELSRWKIAPLSRGLNFVGWRTWRKTRFIRKHSLHTFSRRLKQGRIDSLVSILGHAKHTASHRHLCRRVKAERPELLTLFPPTIMTQLEAA